MIPDNAKVAYDGKIFKVYEWKQKLFDGSYETFEAVQRRGTVQLILVHEGNIILLDEEAPTGERFISMPGGMVDWGEDPRKAAERELLEETGMKAKIELYHESSHKGKLYWDSHYFICKDSKKVSDPEPEAGERFSLIYLSYDDFLEKVFSDDFRNLYFQKHMRLLKAEGRLDELRQKLGL